MTTGFTNRPKIVRGAFVEYGLSLPPLFVVFQFNPVQLTRSRSLSFAPENNAVAPPPEGESEEARQARLVAQRTSLREFHQREFEDEDNLLAIRDRQQVRVQEESISFEIRLDATDDMGEGDPIAAGFGIGPRLATLELMVHPKEESLIGAALGALLGSPGGFSFTRGQNPPMTLFIWGMKRVLPVNINSLSITETEFNPNLDPIRATVVVNLTVIESKSPVYLYSKAMKEVASALNLANITDIANVVIPG